jgi:hypothetical protein
MHQYDKVLSYIDYFTSAGEEVSTLVHNPPNKPYLNYSSEMISFIQEVYQVGLLDTEYLPYLERHLQHKANYTEYTDTADIRLLRAIVINYVRQERFQEGLWIVSAQDGIFSKIFMRLYEYRSIRADGLNEQNE